MTQATKLSLIETVNAITQLNGLFLSKVSEIDKANGTEDLTDDQKKSLVDASMKLSQAGTKILESCK